MPTAGATTEQPKIDRVRVLCAYPPFPPTYWGAEHTRRFTGKRGFLPPLGLMTIAALLPRGWPVRLCDLNVRGPLTDEEIDWADVVFLSGMLIQRDAILALAERCRARGKRVVLGGPYASTSPDSLVGRVDCVVVGEAEELMAPLAALLETPGAALPPRLQAESRPDMSMTPIPRYDLIDASQYISMGIQWSRGCPFNCEFCDIIEIFGRKPRIKSPAQLAAELDAIHATGYRGSVFVVDDNFIGNKVEVRRLLVPLAAWMRAHGDPFDLYTEASVNLAADQPLIDSMVEAGFTSVFLGIETPAPEALKETQKLQNTVVDLRAGVETLIRSGLEVMAGFIVGFDADDDQAVERQREWIAASPIPLAMVGVLIALPGTQLERRLAREGRLLEESGGDNFDRTNFVTRMGEVELLEGYARLLAEVYSPAAYFDRAARMIALRPPNAARHHRRLGFALRCLALSLWYQGIAGDYRRHYWAYLWRIVRRSPRAFSRAIGLAINGEHMIRFTREDVLPRLHRAIAEARTSPRAARPLHKSVPILAERVVRVGRAPHSQSILSGAARR